MWCCTERGGQCCFVWFSQDQVIQLVNSIFSKKSWDTLSEAFSIASATSALANNRFHKPVIVSALGSAAVSHSQPLLQVNAPLTHWKKISNILRVFSEAQDKPKDWKMQKKILSLKGARNGLQAQTIYFGLGLASFS